MASSYIITHRSFCFSSAAKLPVHLRRNLKLEILSCPLLETASIHCLKLGQKHIPRATSEEVADEDSKFVPLNAEDPQFGPPALLLLGFEASEVVKIQKLLKELDGEFLEIIFCTEDMIDRSLWEAMNTKQSDLNAAKIAKQLPRICFISGLSGEEMMMFIDAFPESGLDPPVFAALVPNSASKPVRELMEEIMGDHEMMMARESG